MGGPPSGGMGGPPGGGMGGPPSAPKSSVQFFSVGGGGTAPVPAPSSGQGMPPPPSSQQQYTSPPPTMGGDFQQQGHGQGQQMYTSPPNGGGMVNMQQPPHMGNSSSFGNMSGMGGVPSGFDSGVNNFGSGMGGSMQGQVQTGQMQPGQIQPGQMQEGQQPDPNSAAQQLPRLEDMDLTIQCDQRFLRSSVGKVIHSQGIAQQSRFPLGIVCHPMSGEGDGAENSEVEVVDFGATGIVRCKRCRTYINPFVSWVDNGRRWRCNICGMLNDVPTSYFSHLDQQGQRRDKDQRPELNRCSVEFVAPGDYMVRPPQPPVFFFVIDVTSTAGSSGMLASCVNAIKEALDNLPGHPRTNIGENTKV